MNPKNQIRIGIWSEPRDGIRKWKSLCLKFATSKSKTANLGTLCLVGCNQNLSADFERKHFKYSEKYKTLSAVLPVTDGKAVAIVFNLNLFPILLPTTPPFSGPLQARFCPIHAGPF